MISDIRSASEYGSFNRVSKSEASSTGGNASESFTDIMENKTAQKQQSDSKTETRDELLEEIQQKNREMYEKLKHGETEEKVQIGGSEFTATDWKKLLVRVDKEIDTMKKNVKEEAEKAKEKALKKENQKVVLYK